ncbi:uncharacterized protein FTOL_00702 [Fusarium torulosum]|uniref:Uncharacterized protein n=1 Tax=Fusarium torulosum TaxID=33205 RepID=A0AAE8LYT2_9HYPO|nr:uncharacterized protein FTOL_00702 [Fusarium torulosum]
MRTRSGTVTHEDNTASPKPREPKAKQAKNTKKSNAEASPSTPEKPKPTLTEKDLEFDFDHSQIRDPRATPGRVKRPHYEERELSEEFLSKFHIPKSRNKHTDPFAGFQLDYKKVEKWMKPVAYNKKSMVNGMERRLKKAEEEREAAYKAFFVDGKGPENDKGTDIMIMDQIKDQVSKDLGVPWHQIDSKQMKKWEDKGFEKVKADEWWSRPNKVERDRFMKMLGGASLRKDL